MQEKVLLVEYPRCSTCQKAKAWLTAHGVLFDDRHIVEQNPTAGELKEWVERSGLPLKRFFNTSGMLYRELGLKEKLPGLSDEQQLDILGSNGMLVKRPLVIGKDFVLAGFREKEWEEKLLK